jgi:uracil-DNA glycosylase
MVQISSAARVLIVGQAPGSVVHETGIPWDDKSGDQLRDWMGVEKATFYDASKIALMPMGFCYPGKGSSGGDAPPRSECAPLWHDRLLKHLPNIKLTVLTGMYAQRYYLRDAGKTLIETVKNWREHTPRFLPLPHPSWRSRLFVAKNPWFEKDVLPWFRKRVRDLLR